MKYKGHIFRNLSALAIAVCSGGGSSVIAQTRPPLAPTPITLDEAIHRAQISEVNYRTAAANRSVAGLDKTIARSALLPGVIYHNSYIYTKPGQQPLSSTLGTTSRCCSHWPYQSLVAC